MGLILRKVSEEEKRYERALDFRNVAQKIAHVHSSCAREIACIGDSESRSWALSKIHLTPIQIHVLICVSLLALSCSRFSILQAFDFNCQGAMHEKETEGFPYWPPVTVLFAAVALALTARVPFGMEQTNQQVSQQLLAAYHHAFYLYNHAGGIAQPASGKPGYPLPDSLRRDLGLSSSEFIAFGKGALDFRQIEQTTEAQIESVERADLVSHPSARNLTPAAKARIHSLFLEMRHRESDAINAIHSGLDKNTAATLDASAISVYEQARAQTILSLPSTSLLSRSSSFSSNRVQPEYSEPPACAYPDEEEEEDEDCVDGGGVFDLENCTCGYEGGGGGGGTDPFPIVTVTAASAAYGQPLDPVITATVAGTSTDDPVPTGAVDFSLKNSNNESNTAETPDVALSGVATWSALSTMVIPAASYTITAAYQGNDDYEAINGTNSAEVMRAESVTSITNCPSSAIASGQSFSLQISVTWYQAPTVKLGGLDVAQPSGQVTLNGIPSANPMGNLSPGLAGPPATVTIPITLNGAGAYVISADYQGDTNYSPATSTNSCAITVN